MGVVRGGWLPVFPVPQVVPSSAESRCVILSLDSSRLEAWLSVFAGGARRLRLWRMQQKFTTITYESHKPASAMQV